MLIDRRCPFPGSRHLWRGHEPTGTWPTDRVLPFLRWHLQQALHVCLQKPSVALKASHVRHLSEEEFIPNENGDASAERLRMVQSCWPMLFAKPCLRSEDAASGLPFEIRPTCLHLQQDAAEVLARLRDLDEPIFAPALRESALLAHHASTACTKTCGRQTAISSVSSPPRDVAYRDPEVRVTG